MDLSLYDNTRLEAFRTCPRLYLFRHVYGWRPEEQKAALAFGKAWHAAMDVLWPLMVAQRGSSPKRWTHDKADIIQLAFNAFHDAWLEAGFPGVEDMDSDVYQSLAPRTPSTAFDMLHEYADTRHIFLTTGDIELLAIEEPFVVPLDPENRSLFYCGRFDKLIRWEKRIHAVEHKTTSAYAKNGPFRRSVLESYSPNSQVDGYLFSGHSRYGDQFKDVMVDLALVHASQTGFRFVSVDRLTEQLDAWLWEVRYWINQIQANERALAQQEAERVLRKNKPYLAAFPKNTRSCIQFESTCPYMDICKSWSNPMGHDVPLGFVHEPWEPFKELALHKIFGEETANDDQQGPPDAAA